MLRGPHIACGTRRSTAEAQRFLRHAPSPPPGANQLISAGSDGGWTGGSGGDCGGWLDVGGITACGGCSWHGAGGQHVVTVGALPAGVFLGAANARKTLCSAGMAAVLGDRERESLRAAGRVDAAETPCCERLLATVGLVARRVERRAAPQEGIVGHGVKPRVLVEAHCPVLHDKGGNIEPRKPQRCVVDDILPVADATDARHAPLAAAAQWGGAHNLARQAPDCPAADTRRDGLCGSTSSSAAPIDCSVTEIFTRRWLRRRGGRWQRQGWRQRRGAYGVIIQLKVEKLGVALRPARTEEIIRDGQLRTRTAADHLQSRLGEERDNRGLAEREWPYQAHARIAESKAGCHAVTKRERATNLAAG
eukprot:5851793-Prymnesium_polylepis.1